MSFSLFLSLFIFLLSSSSFGGVNPGLIPGRESVSRGSWRRKVIDYLAQPLQPVPNQVDALSGKLERRGFRCWYDNKMEKLTKDSMADGVQKNCFVLLFLSEGVLTRPFVQLEIGVALEAKKL